MVDSFANSTPIKKLKKAINEADNKSEAGKNSYKDKFL